MNDETTAYEKLVKELEDLHKEYNSLNVLYEKCVALHIQVNQVKVIADKELAFQNTEKEKRAAALIVANKELTYQNEEKAKRAAELIIANKELVHQNEEKEKRAAELVIAIKELAFQNKEKENRALELINITDELRKSIEDNSYFILREVKMVELKNEINALLKERGGEEKYYVAT